MTTERKKVGMDRLEEARIRIDEIDRRMAELFRKRMEAVAAVAAHKQENGLPIFDAARERIVLERNAAAYADEKTHDLYIAFLQDVMELSKRYQKRLLEP